MAQAMKVKRGQKFLVAQSVLKHWSNGGIFHTTTTEDRMGCEHIRDDMVEVSPWLLMALNLDECRDCVKYRRPA